MESFIEVIPELMNLNGSYLFEDHNRGIHIRAGLSEQPFGDRLKNHKDTLLLRNTFTQQRPFYKWYPDDSIDEDVIRRREKLKTSRHQSTSWFGYG